MYSTDLIRQSVGVVMAYGGTKPINPKRNVNRFDLLVGLPYYILKATYNGLKDNSSQYNSFQRQKHWVTVSLLSFKSQ